MQLSSANSRGYLPALRALAALAVCSCERGAAPDTELPAIPELTVEEFSAPVQRQILDAYAQLQAHPRDAAANLSLGNILHAYKLLPWAIACYERARLLQPGEYATAYYLGIASAQAGADQPAINNLRATLRLRPDYAPARLRLGELLFKTGRLDEARALFEALLAENADSPWAYYQLARVLTAQGALPAAIDHHLRAVELFPAFGPAHYALAMAYRQQGRAEPAALHMERYQAHPDGKPPHVDPLMEALLELDISASAMIARARRLEAAGLRGDAVQALEQAVAADPGSIEARSQLVRLYAGFDRFDKAEEHYLAVTAVRPNAVQANLNYGTVLARQGRFTEAAAAFARVLEASPDHSMGHTLLGQAREELEDADAAERHYRQALASDSRNHRASILLARRLAGTGRLDEATPLLTRTLEAVDRDRAFYLYQVALVYAEAERRDLAQAYLQQAGDAARESGPPSLLQQIEETGRQWRGDMDR